MGFKRAPGIGESRGCLILGAKFSANLLALVIGSAHERQIFGWNESPVASSLRGVALRMCWRRDFDTEKRIVIDPAICNGRPAVRDTRIIRQTVLEFLGAADSIEDVLKENPSISREDVLGCLRFSSQLMGIHLWSKWWREGLFVRQEYSELSD